MALLAASSAERWTWNGPRFRSALVALLFLAPSLWACASLAQAGRRPTPAERASVWVAANLPAGSRVLQDQLTPRLDPNRYRAYRLRVEEKRFLGNFDWVIVSGYPPGLRVEGLRQVAEFEIGDALGTGIRVFQVGDRERLMPLTHLDRSAVSVSLGAGELPYFGEGWYPPEPGAFATSRLSRGKSSEIFFRLGPEVPGDVVATFSAAQAVIGDPFEIRVELGGETAGRLEIESDELREYPLELSARLFSPGLNRMVLSYPETVRLNRRHQDTGLRLFALELKVDGGVSRE